MPIALDNLPDDPAPLNRIITAIARDALVAQAEIARLSFPLAVYRRAKFDCSSEKLAHETEQLELVLETVEARPGRRARYGAHSDEVAH